MTDKKPKRPVEGTPEFEKWLEERAKKHMNEMFGDDYKPADFENGGPIFGDIENLGKSDAELFPDELGEHTPQERREKFKVHSNDKKKDDKKLY